MSDEVSVGERLRRLECAQTLMPMAIEGSWTLADYLRAVVLLAETVETGAYPDSVPKAAA